MESDSTTPTTKCKIVLPSFIQNKCTINSVQIDTISLPVSTNTPIIYPIHPSRRKLLRPWIETKLTPLITSFPMASVPQEQISATSDYTTSSATSPSCTILPKIQYISILTSPYTLLKSNPLVPSVAVASFGKIGHSQVLRVTNPTLAMKNKVKQAIPFPAILPYLPTYLNTEVAHVAPSAIPNSKIGVYANRPLIPRKCPKTNNFLPTRIMSYKGRTINTKFSTLNPFVHDNPYLIWATIDTKMGPHNIWISPSPSVHNIAMYINTLTPQQAVLYNRQLNCAISAISTKDGRSLEAIIVILKPIQPGEELYCSYGNSYRISHSTRRHSLPNVIQPRNPVCFYDESSDSLVSVVGHYYHRQAFNITMVPLHPRRQRGDSVEINHDGTTSIIDTKSFKINIKDENKGPEVQIIDTKPGMPLHLPYITNIPIKDDDLIATSRAVVPPLTQIKLDKDGLSYTIVDTEAARKYKQEHRKEQRVQHRAKFRNKSSTVLPIIRRAQSTSKITLKGSYLVDVLIENKVSVAAILDSGADMNLLDHALFLALPEETQHHLLPLVDYEQPLSITDNPLEVHGKLSLTFVLKSVLYTMDFLVTSHSGKTGLILGNNFIRRYVRKHDYRQNILYLLKESVHTYAYSQYDPAILAVLMEDLTLNPYTETSRFINVILAREGCI
jgi:hypothetical protein